MSEQLNRSYYAVIPAEVRYDKDLPANAKLLYGEITALTNDKGYCWASNDYFAQLYGVTKISISNWISILVDKGYIQNEILYKDNTKQIIGRHLKINLIPIKENFNRGIKEIFNNNNKDINNKKECIRFKPPTLEEVEEYAREKGYFPMAQKFYDYFNEGNWIDSKGNKVKNWKQKFLTWATYNTKNKSGGEFKTQRKYTEKDFEGLYQRVEDVEV